MEERLGQLVTERSNSRSTRIDQMSALEIVSLMNDEDGNVAASIKSELPQIARVIDAIADSFQRGGRLIYIGAGTSGRLGVLDASECPPTFRTPPEMVQAIIAGGDQAMRTAIEGAEDSKDQGEADLAQLNVSKEDLVVGIAASGRTPYVMGALICANKVGAATAAISCNKNAAISQYADFPIEIVVGPEILTGSTRLKAATAQKMVLNMLSTASMIKVGKVYRNQMVDLHASNEKLVQRAQNIVMDITGVKSQEAASILQQTNHEVKPAILMILGGVSLAKANQLLQETNGFLREAIEIARQK
ncbi:N-acetylmuramic acid 6-phosphate etherase [Pseudogracilibacillus auburnensis]|uniref:N-acetylmuramic acid 6-phosphate etherase n=1 Tax=Pseudogracilibacillus auburnensis TaxID=1494959 RepID=UPI001A96B62A|nr:N-acetylmuramic acid 6-phosphate etherase [Pseudogracilibacillus auburnensis]MBO1005892.1 N-acetylmuramic acid 6-phosphate etherase [Pseudogracilibacillus auburnensis]